MIINFWLNQIKIIKFKQFWLKWMTIFTISFKIIDFINQDLRNFKPSIIINLN